MFPPLIRFWGARVNSDTDRLGSDTSNRVWGTDNTYDTGLWSGIPADSASATKMFGQATETTAAGDNIKIQFGAEIGADKIQPTGTYQQEVTFTAMTL